MHPAPKEDPAPVSPAPPPATTARPVIKPIVYDLPPAQTASSALSDTIEEEQAKHARRAYRFNTPVVPARDVSILGARRAAVRTGFITGFDPLAPEHAAQRARRAEKFGLVPLEEKHHDDPPDALPVASPDPLERRRDAAVADVPRENVLHVFGVDSLSTAQIMAHFREYGPTWCEWLNDSSCNVAFEDTFTLARVLRGMCTEGHPGMEEPVDRMGDGDGAGGSLPVAGEGRLRDEFQWRPAKTARTTDAVVPLWIRMATENDKRPVKPNPKSKWSRSINRQTHEREQGRRRQRSGEAEQRRRARDQGVSLSVQKTRDAIAKVKAKKMTRADLDKALSS